MTVAGVGGEHLRSGAAEVTFQQDGPGVGTEGRGLEGWGLEGGS